MWLVRRADRELFEAIAAYFNHSLVVKPGKMVVIEGGDTALVIMGTHLEMTGERWLGLLGHPTGDLYLPEKRGRKMALCDRQFGMERTRRRST